MSDLDQALQHLTKAVARLEAAARGSERPVANADVDAASTEAAAIVAARLDDAIARLDHLLES